jgi:AAA family ATP:ADP antiporter
MTRSPFDRVLARALRPFARIEPAEAIGVVVLSFTSFLLLTAYYLLKTAREPLILLHGGAEVKSYAAAGQAALLLIVVQAYAAVARRVGTLRLLASVYLFFASNLLVFAMLARAGAAIGVPFFLWVGVFNYTAIAQFWAFAADVYVPEQGKRIFAVLGIGSSVGAVAGARIAKAMVPLGPAILMVTAAVILVVCILLFMLAGRHVAQARETASTSASNEPVGAEGPFRLLMRDRYLLLIAGLTIVLNWCNANGEYILDRTLLAAVGDGRHGPGSAAAFIGAFKADYFGWVNAVGVLLQLFAVSRIVTRYGVRNALLVLPAVAFMGYGSVLVAPVLALIRVAKIAENSLDYSLQNTARQALYLVTSRHEKYVGKTLVDTFLVRSGDALSALAVLFASRNGLSTQAFAGLNLALIVVWAAIVFALGKEYARRAGESAEQVAAEPSLSRKHLVAGVLLVAGLSGARNADAAEPTKRALPDYEGRPPSGPTVGEVLLWIPRTIFSPVYFTTEYLIRRPIVAAITAAERADLPRALYDFFAFGPDHKAGIVPIAFVDFGFNPSLGAYGFWDDALFKGDDLRAHFVGWPTAWLGGSVVQRARFGGGNTATVRLAGIRRPDYTFFGLGPRSPESERSRYGSDRVEASANTLFPGWRASRVETGVGVRYANFYDGHYGGDPGIFESVNARAYPLPEAFTSGYAEEFNRLAVALDSRKPFPDDGSGLRLEAQVEQGSGFGPLPPGGWIRYGGGAAGFLDLDGHRRVVSLSLQAAFADPLGNTPIPFTELVSLGGESAPMPGFLAGRMIDRSAGVASLRYDWPIGPWLDGSLQAAVGNVFGEHLEGFEPRLTRLSAALGFASDVSPDSNFEFLIGFGTETFEQGGKIDSFRLAIGTSRGL